MKITVYGMPAPQGSKKFLGVSKAGRGILGESSAKVKPWRQDVKAAALMACDFGRKKIAGPVLVRMVFTMPKPKSAPKRARSYPSKMPDLSKLARSTEDALTDAGVWEDDSRVIEYSRLAKVFPNEDPESLPCPGVVITIEPVVGAIPMAAAA